jgi:hypothetical protein
MKLWCVKVRSESKPEWRLVGQAVSASEWWVRYTFSSKEAALSKCSGWAKQLGPGYWYDAFWIDAPELDEGY